MHQKYPEMGHTACSYSTPCHLTFVVLYVLKQSDFIPPFHFSPILSDSWPSKAIFHQSGNIPAGFKCRIKYIIYMYNAQKETAALTITDVIGPI